MNLPENIEGKTWDPVRQQWIKKRRSIDEICAEIRTLKLKVKPRKTYKHYG